MLPKITIAFFVLQISFIVRPTNALFIDQLRNVGKTDSCNDSESAGDRRLGQISCQFNLLQDEIEIFKLQLQCRLLYTDNKKWPYNCGDYGKDVNLLHYTTFVQMVLIPYVASEKEIDPWKVRYAKIRESSQNERLIDLSDNWEFNELSLTSQSNSFLISDFLSLIPKEYQIKTLHEAIVANTFRVLLLGKDAITRFSNQGNVNIQKLPTFTSGSESYKINCSDKIFDNWIGERENCPSLRTSFVRVQEHISEYFKNMIERNHISKFGTNSTEPPALNVSDVNATHPNSTDYNDAAERLDGNRSEMPENTSKSGNATQTPAEEQKEINRTQSNSTLDSTAKTITNGSNDDASSVPDGAANRTDVDTNETEENVEFVDDCHDTAGASSTRSNLSCICLCNFVNATKNSTIVCTRECFDAETAKFMLEMKFGFRRKNNSSADGKNNLFGNCDCLVKIPSDFTFSNYVSKNPECDGTEFANQTELGTHCLCEYDFGRGAFSSRVGCYAEKYADFLVKTSKGYFPKIKNTTDTKEKSCACDAFASNGNEEKDVLDGNLKNESKDLDSETIYNLSGADPNKCPDVDRTSKTTCFCNDTHTDADLIASTNKTFSNQIICDENWKVAFMLWSGKRTPGSTLNGTTVDCNCKIFSNDTAAALKNNSDPGNTTDGLNKTNGFPNKNETNPDDDDDDDANKTPIKIQKYYEICNVANTLDSTKDCICMWVGSHPKNRPEDLSKVQINSLDFDLHCDDVEKIYNLTLSLKSETWMTANSTRLGVHYDCGCKSDGFFKMLLENKNNYNFKYPALILIAIEILLVTAIVFLTCGLRWLCCSPDNRRDSGDIYESNSPCQTGCTLILCSCFQFFSNLCYDCTNRFRPDYTSNFNDGDNKVMIDVENQPSVIYKKWDDDDDNDDLELVELDSQGKPVIPIDGERRQLEEEGKTEDFQNQALRSNDSAL